jgi:protein SCO1/2
MKRKFFQKNTPLSNPFRLSILGVVLGLSLWQCGDSKPKKLTIYPIVLPNKAPEVIPIPDFKFTNQNNQLIDNQTFKDKIYVADFFFTSCPTICPKVKAQMKRIYDRFKNEPRLALLSHTIDPKRDSVARLKTYSEKLGVTDANRWHFVTGEKDSIYNLARYYNSVAVEDKTAPGGFDHSGYIVLIDKKRQIRSIARGTEAEEVDRFMRDIETLLLENE